MKEDFIRIRYDGPALKGHSIDVNYLAPALLAIGDLCKLSNNKFNQGKASVKVLVNVDLEQNCFELNLQVVLDIYEQAKSLIGDEDVSSAKEILEWIGIIVPASLTGAFGLFRFVKWLNGRKISSTEIVQKDGKDFVQITVEGENNTVNVYPQTYQLLKEPKAIKSIQEIVKPLSDEGYESLEFEQNKKVNESVNKEEAKEILKINIQEDIEDEEEPQEVTAWISVYSPVYDKHARLWRFEYSGHHEFMDISETGIAEQAFARGGALIDDAYRVRLEIKQFQTEAGKFKNHFKILEVLDFKPSKIHGQDDLFKDEGED